MKMDANKMLVMVAVGCFALAGTSIGGFYYIDSESRTRSEPDAAGEAAKLAHYKREVEPHRLTVVAHVYRAMKGRRATSVPVMIKLVISGRKALRAVCGRLPHVKEAVLRALAPGGGTTTDASGRLDLAKMEPRLRQAISRATQGASIKSLHAVMAGGSMRMGSARETCRAALKPVARKG